MRKKWTAFLCALLCMALFAGCSPTEIGYLKMSREMMPTMQKSEVKGSVDVTLDFDELKTMVTKTANASGVPKEAIDTTLDSVKDLTGKKQLVVDYTMQMEMEPLGYVMDTVVTYDGQKYPMGKMYFSMEKGMYISKEAIYAYYQILGKMAGKTDTFLYQNPEFVKEWKALLDKTDYICVASAEDLTQQGTGNTSVQMDMNKLMDAAFNMYEKGFSGFTTGMVSEIAGGYHISANGTQIQEMLLHLIQYAAENPTQVVDAVGAYLKASLAFAGELGESTQDFTDALEEMKESPEEVKNTLVKLKEMASALLAKESVSIWLKGFSYEADVVKKDGSYEVQEQYTLKNDSRIVLQVHSKQTMQKANKTLTFPTASISMEDFSEQVKELVEKYNPVEAVSVVWRPAEEEKIAVVSLERTESLPMFDTQEMVEYHVVDGRVYLPARTICEKIGLDMNWDKAARKVSVVKNGKQIPVDTQLFEGVSYMGVRDLKQLGFDVSYTRANGVHTVSVAV